VAQIAGLVALVVSVLVVLAALFVGLRAREAVPDGNAPVYRVRKYYALVLIGVLAGALAFTLPLTPYRAYAAVEPVMRVEVTGGMWNWQMKRSGEGPFVIPAGKLIQFDVSSVDVNHGFGLYDDAGRLLGQAQVMPGYVNHLRVVFDKPGRYHVLCMEYCGVAHHVMFSEFTVQ
jgi:cytochrome c oxidase subunit 2